MSHTATKESGSSPWVGGLRRNYQALLARTSALQEGIFVVQRFPGEIHLRHQTVALAGDVEMDMRGAASGRRAGRICSRLDGLDPVAPFRIGGYDREALEIGIQRRWIMVTRVRVAPWVLACQISMRAPWTGWAIGVSTRPVKWITCPPLVPACPGCSSDLHPECGRFVRPDERPRI